MTEVENKISLTETQFAHLGEGVVAYMREIDSDDLKTKFPGLPEIDSGLRLWALFAANGQPIMLTDEKSSALASAMQHDLTPVSIH
ncbi:DUF1150 family protein [Tianweitania populi]|jgi:hypothetical protein|uniref:DUF1150 domain-containing protein n=1 Tax=Tianweitania populi TaxID=1607949 RepID=A0A8J3GL51_9HYPH|nr:MULTISPECIES: DUF1150 family protein [Tianweitania]GHD15687.1 hypothetical protein GCM10016234_22920 [Tianweitania populi]